MWKAQESHVLILVFSVKKTIYQVTLCNKECQSSELCFLVLSVALRRLPGFRLDDTNGLICTLINLDLSRTIH